MGFLRTFKKVADGIELILKICLIISLGGIVAVVNLSVFFRYVLNSPLSWTTELAQFLLVFTVVFAASVALRHDMFVNVQAIRDLLPERTGKIVATTARTLIGGFLVFCVISPEAMIEKALRTDTISPAMSIPMASVYRIMQLGFAVMVLFLVFGALDSALRERESRKKGESRS